MRHIDIEEEYGNASGYVVETSKVQVGNYLSEYTDKAQDIAQWLKSHCGDVAILKNINVEESCRGQGHGNDLLSGFMDEALDRGAQAVLLISDAGETQSEGFSLDAWYAGNDFEPVCSTAAGAFMVFPVDLALQMKEDLFGPSRKPRP